MKTSGTGGACRAAANDVLARTRAVRRAPLPRKNSLSLSPPCSLQHAAGSGGGDTCGSDACGGGALLPRHAACGCDA
jgi:hypothetical protein